MSQILSVARGGLWVSEHLTCNLEHFVWYKVYLPLLFNHQEEEEGQDTQEGEEDPSSFNTNVYGKE